MNGYGGKDIARAFRTVRKNTLQIAEEIPEQSYGFAAAPGTRSVAELLAHLAATPRLQIHLHGEKRLSTLVGFDFFGYWGGLAAEAQKPRSKAEIVEWLRSSGEEFAQWAEGLSDDFLAEWVTYPPGMEPAGKTRFEMIISAKEHEMHHRGQLMLIERILGMTPHLTRQMMARIEERQK
jgi:uncharacterized damage-inducible protein DinB